MSTCNHDCFNCSYDDCICEDYTDDLALDMYLDRMATRSYDSLRVSQRKYRATEKGKQAVRRWNHSEKHKKIMNNYNKSAKGKERSKRFEQTEKRKAYRREWQKRKYWENKAKKEDVYVK